MGRLGGICAHRCAQEGQSSSERGVLCKSVNHSTAVDLCDHLRPANKQLRQANRSGPPGIGLRNHRRQNGGDGSVDIYAPFEEVGPSERSSLQNDAWPKPLEKWV